MISNPESSDTPRRPTWHGLRATALATALLLCLSLNAESAAANDFGAALAGAGIGFIAGVLAGHGGQGRRVRAAPRTVHGQTKVVRAAKSKPMTRKVASKPGTGKSSAEEAGTTPETAVPGPVAPGPTIAPTAGPRTVIPAAATVEPESVPTGALANPATPNTPPSRAEAPPTPSTPVPSVAAPPTPQTAPPPVTPPPLVAPAPSSTGGPGIADLH